MERRRGAYSAQSSIHRHSWCGGVLISYQGRSLIHIYESGETVTAKSYTNTVVECYQQAGLLCYHFDHYNCLGPGMYILLQDGARPHTAPLTTTAFRRLHINTLANYPSSSPDLNIIEHIWAWIKLKIKSHSPRTRNELTHR